jgi:hypothetical protein
METVKELSKEATSFLNPQNIVQNTFLFGVLVLFIALYGPRLQPLLPHSVRNLFDNTAFRAFIIFLIVFFASSNSAVSLTLMVAYLVVMQLVQMSHLTEKFRENFEMYGPPVADCRVYNTDSINVYGQYYYPLSDTNEYKKMRQEYEGALVGAEYKPQINYNAGFHPIPPREDMKLYMDK